MTYRIYVEETTTRLVYTDVDVTTRRAAEALGQAAIDTDAWMDWTECDTGAYVELREELTAIVDIHGQETRLRGPHATRR